MLVLRNLVEAGARRITNYYRSDIRFEHTNCYGLVKNQGTGLKGGVANWVKRNLPHERVKRVRVEGRGSGSGDGDGDGEDCNSYSALVADLRSEAESGSNRVSVIFAAGYTCNDPPTVVSPFPLQPPAAVDLPSYSYYHKFNGSIPFPGSAGAASASLFGAGIAFPQFVVDPSGGDIASSSSSSSRTSHQHGHPWVGFRRRCRNDIFCLSRDVV